MSKCEKNLKWYLSELSVAEPEQYETGSIEIIGEDDQGREGSCEIGVSDLATAAKKKIEELETEKEALESQLDAAYQLLSELREHGDYGTEWDEKITKLIA